MLQGEGWGLTSPAPTRAHSSSPTCLHPTSDAAAVEAWEQSSKPWSPSSQRTAVLAACVLPVLQSGAGESLGNQRGKGRRFDFHSLGLFPLPLSHSPLPPPRPPFLPHCAELESDLHKGD